MNIVAFEDAPAYEAPGHTGMRMRRLQGREAGPADTVWIGCSVLEPGGGTTATASAVEKFYVCLEGSVRVIARQGGEGEEGQTVDLHPLDSCRIAPAETRELRNCTALPARLLLVMPLDQLARPKAGGS
jgi:hypothetical protein